MAKTKDLIEEYEEDFEEDHELDDILDHDHGEDLEY